MSAGDGAEPAVGGEQPIDGGDDICLAGTRQQCQRQAVEAAFHVEGGREPASVHPEDAESRVIGDELPRPDAVDILGRQRDADDEQLAAPAVDDRPDAIAGTERARERECLAHEHFVGLAQRGKPATPEEHVVEHRLVRNRDADQASGRRLGETGHIERDIHDHARLHACDARNLFDARHQGERRPNQRSEHLGKAVAVVVGLLRQPERGERAQIHDEHRHAGADDEADGQRLSLQVPEIAKEFPIERAHYQVSSEGASFFSFRRSLRMRPSESETTRSAIPATAALCVMTAVVVPSSRFTR